MTAQEIKQAMFMATDDLLNGTITVKDSNEIGKRCRRRMKAIAAMQKLATAAIVVVATVLMMTPTMADGGLGLRLQAEIGQHLMELDARFANRGILCFELGDGSSKSYQAAECRGVELDGLPMTCTFDNGDPETGCFKRSDGCLVCAGID